jgi:hypothetical protein
MKLVRILSELAFVTMLVSSVGCVMTGEDPRDDSTPAAETTSTSESQVTVPEQFQLVPATPTCKSQKGACIPLRLCNEQNNHHPVPGTGCSATTVCCVAG